MNNYEKGLLFVLLCCVSMVSVYAAPITYNETHYEHVLTVDVLCTEYIGNVRFELPDTFEDTHRYTSDHELSIYSTQEYYQKNQNWFVTAVDGYDIRQTETIFDGRLSSNLIVQNSEVTLPFRNPSSQRISRMTIQVSDSLLNSITISANGRDVPFTTTKSGFFTQLDLLGDGVIADEIDVTLNYDDIAKISEVAFFTKQNDQSKRYGYFYVNNNCNQTAQFFYGTYGAKSPDRAAKSLPVTFQTVVNSGANPLYNNDFDSDGVSNAVDNCLSVSNSDQKDIDYNSVGDACQDADRDGVYDPQDNCPTRSNYDQSDVDADGVGDKCDEDDNRFLEENTAFVYLLGFLIAVAFVVFAIKIAKK